MKQSRISQILESGLEFEKYSYAELSRMFNYDSSKLRKKLIEKGIVCSRSSEFNPLILKSKETIEEIRKLAADGNTYSFIAETLKLSLVYVRKLATDNGIKVRRHFPILEGCNEMQVLIGTILGDGSIDDRKEKAHNSRLTMKHSIKQLDYLKFKISLLSTLNSDNSKITEITRLSNFKDGRGEQSLVTSCNWRSIADAKLTALRAKWYPNGVKIVPIDINLDPIAIAIWFMDDGTSTPHNARFCTEGFTIEDCNILIRELVKYDINAYTWVNKRKQPQIVVPSKSIEAFIKLIYPYMCDSMLYKLTKLKKYKGDLTVN